MAESGPIYSPRRGPLGEDLDLQLSSNNSAKLKEAALQLRTVLHIFKGASHIKDDLPFGQQQCEGWAESSSLSRL